MTPPLPVVAIVGPTASGKTALSLDVARRLDGEIIAMDSRQVYRGMDIGTAKATPVHRVLVPHHGLDLIDPGDRFSAGRFARLAREWIGDIQGRGRVPILVGGTGFFLRGLTRPIFHEPPLDPARRGALSRYQQGVEDAELHRWLRALDPMTADRLATWGGRQRLLRALEIPLLTGRPLSWWYSNAPAEAEPVHPTTFVLDLPREVLRARIENRVGEMVEQGLVGEVARLVEAGFDVGDPGMKATGYVELIPYLRGETTLEAALEQVRRNTWAYARRQLTWLRNQLPNAFRLDATRSRAELVDEIVHSVRSAGEAVE